MPATDLIISEYIEGSSFNKALELFNGTGAAINLTGYRVLVYFNGSTTPSFNVALTGTVAAGDVFVLAQATANALILAQADQLTSASWFNGDDAIVLVKNVTTANPLGEVVDSIGQIGVDPGTEWGSGLTSTADNTIVRDPSITSGDTNASDAFNPATQWIGFATDTFGGLGAHATNGEPRYTITALSADKPEGDSGVTQYTFTVTRPSGAAAEDVAFTTSVAGSQPADADPDDFAVGVFPSGTVSFAVGETSKILTIDVTGDLSAEVNESFTVTLGVIDSPSAQGVIRNDDVVLTQIADIQGAAHTSPLVGVTVSALGIVTAVASNGFWIQDPTPDADARTSDGIFIFTSRAPAAGIVAGAEVRVTGLVTEFFPNSQTTADLSLTEISIGTTGSVQLTGNFGTIAPTLVGVGGLLPPTEIYGDDGDIFDPATQGLDFWESLEGTLVTLNDAVAAGPSDTNTSFNDTEVFVTLDGAASGVTPSGGVVVTATDFNPERIAVQEDRRTFDNNFTANVGDRLGDVTGVVNYTSGAYYELLATSSFAVTPGGIAREVTTNLVAGENQLTIASYNAENLTFGNPQAKFDEIAIQIVTGLRSPDIIALQEVQDDSGAANDGTVVSTLTLDKLVAAITAAGGPTYSYVYISPINGMDGGQPGGNIRQVFLYNDARVDLAAGAIGGSTEAIGVSDDGGEADLSLAVGRIDPTNEAFNRSSILDYSASRKPLVAEFIFNGESVFVINNHFASKIGDDPLFGANQPPIEETEAQRIAQAKIVADFVAQILAIDPDANLAVVGDLNDFPFSDSVQTIDQAGLTNLSDLLPVNERYDYVFQGNSQQLDNILVSDNLGEDAAFDVLHVNAEFAVQTSDHDPMVARLNIAKGLVVAGGNGADVVLGGVGNDFLDGGNGADRIEGGNGKDVLMGGRGDDVLLGGNAADKLFGGRGEDRLTGGAGSDLFVFGSSGGADIVTDYQIGVDTIVFADGIDLKRASVRDVDLDGKLDLVLALTNGSVTLLDVSSVNDVTFDHQPSDLWSVAPGYGMFV